MSRKFAVLCVGAVLLGVVALVSAQETIRRAADAGDDLDIATRFRKSPGLADRLQAARATAVIEDEMVAPAGAQGGPSPASREPSAFVPATQNVPLASETGGPEMPSILKSRPAASTGGGEFASPSARKGVSGARSSQPVAAPSEEILSTRQNDSPPSSRRTARSLPAASGGHQDHGSLIAGQSPALRIETIGPAAIKIGRDANYQIQVSNLGDIEAVDVLVTIELPQSVHLTGNEASAGAARRKVDDGASQLVWTLDRIPPRGQEQLHLKIAPQENRAFELGVDWTCGHARAAARVEVQEPQLSMTLSGPKEMLFGETAVYTISLSNPGTGDAENVVVSLLPSPGSGRAKESSRIGSVAAGQQRQVEIELSAREAGTMEVRVGAEADGGLHGEAVANVLVRRPNLELALEGPKLKYAGSVAVFQARVANTGNAPADDVAAQISLPAGAKHLPGSDGLKPTAGGLAWNVGKLAPGAERVLDFKCELTSAGDNRIEVRAKGAADLAAAADFITTVEALAELKLAVVEPKGPRSTADDAVYEVKVQNRGTKAARQVNVVVQFSEGIEPVSATGARAEVVPGQVIFQPLPRIDAGEEVTLRIVARAEKEGNHIFRAEIKCSDPETRLVYEGTTRYFASESVSQTGTNSVTVPAQNTAARPGQFQLR